jgi:hypothetical protein
VSGITHPGQPVEGQDCAAQPVEVAADKTLTIRQMIDGLCELASIMPAGDLTPVLAWNRCKAAVGKPDVVTVGTVQSGVRNNKSVAVITLDDHA